MQWFPIVDVYSDEPAIPTGYVRLNAIINTMDEPGAVQDDLPEEERSRFELLQIPRLLACLTVSCNKQNAHGPLQVHSCI
jgi:hypothetical protein